MAFNASGGSLALKLLRPVEITSTALKTWKRKFITATQKFSPDRN